MQNNQLGRNTANNKLKFYTSVKNIYSSYGIIGYYRGLVPRLCGIVPMRFLYQGVQNTLNQKLLSHNEHLYARIGKLTFAGVAGATAQSLIDSPIEVLKIRILTSKNTSAVSVIRHTLMSRSFPGFWITYARNIPFAICTNIGVHVKTNSSMYEKFAYGACGGLLGSIISQPLDFIKTDIQRCKGNNDGYKYIYNKFVEIARTNPRLLWTGGTIRAILGFFNMGIGAIAFHRCKAFLS